MRNIYRSDRPVGPDVRQALRAGLNSATEQEVQGIRLDGLSEHYGNLKERKGRRGKAAGLVDKNKGVEAQFFSPSRVKEVREAAEAAEASKQQEKGEREQEQAERALQRQHKKEAQSQKKIEREEARQERDRVKEAEKEAKDAQRAASNKEREEKKQAEATKRSAKQATQRPAARGANNHHFPEDPEPGSSSAMGQAPANRGNVAAATNISIATASPSVSHPIEDSPTPSKASGKRTRSGRTVRPPK